jgi:hypothetical protein
MKRFHVHLHVDDLSRSIGFYSKLFAAEPARVEADYAKWMLDDPAVNFAISTRGTEAGIDHLGIQTDDADELAALKARAEAADMALLDEGATTCCYARSEKHWVTDPQGIAWEHFHTLGNIPVFREAPAQAASASACCAPSDVQPAVPVAATQAACCAPAASTAAQAPSPSEAEAVAVAVAVAGSAVAAVVTPAGASTAAACCPPTPRGRPIGIPVTAAPGKSSCC